MYIKRLLTKEIECSQLELTLALSTNTHSSQKGDGFEWEEYMPEREKRAK